MRVTISRSNSSHPLARWAALGLVIAGLAGCGGTPTDPWRTPPGAGEPGGSQPVTPRELPREEQPSGPRNDPEDVPTNIPQPIPAPEPPADPKQINVRAVANPVNSNPLAVFSQAMPSRVTVYATLTWSKVANASSFRVSRCDDGSDRFVIRANVPSSFRGYQDGGAMNLRVDNDYRYLVEALDSAGHVVARGEDHCKPLYPLAIPQLVAPEPQAENTGIAPEFSWTQVPGAQGYFVEVFSGVYLVPMWRGFRSDTVGTRIKYGEQVDLMAGTIPAIWTTILNPAAMYTWTVTAVKTDTGNAATAKAWAKSNAPAQRFYCGRRPIVSQEGAR